MTDAITATINTFTPANKPPDPDVATIAETQAQLAKLVRDTVDDMMVQRLLTRDNDHPLVNKDDIERVVFKLVEGSTMNEETHTFMTLLRPVVQRDIEARIATLGLINTDPYAAFWKQTAAFLKVVAEQGISLNDVIKSSTARAQVLRQLMNPMSWDMLTLVYIKLLSALSPASQLSGLAPLIDDASSQEFEQGLANSDAQTEPVIQAMIGAMQRAMAQRKHEIWPICELPHIYGF